MNRRYRNIMEFFAAVVLMAVTSIAQAIAPITSFNQEPLSSFHQDLTGNTIAATDVNGNLLYTESYRPYGERLENTTQSQATQPVGNRIWFHSKVQDEATGLQYFGARYYDPVIGRFMGVDPVGFDEGNIHSVNRFAYGNNNPYRYRDPDGNSPIDLAFLAVDVVRLGVAVYQGEGVGSALIDVGLSVVGVVVPVPGAGQALKAARTADRVADAARSAEHVADAGRATNNAAKATKTGEGAASSVTPNNVQSFETKRAAFRAAKRDAGIPTSQTHTTHTKNLKADGLDTQRTATEYDFGGGRKVQDHPAGHKFSDGKVYDKSHFNNHGTGGTKGHYEY